MTFFEKHFRHKSPHVQPVQTTHDGWESHLNESQKRDMRMGSVIKVTAIVGAAAILGLAAIPVLATALTLAGIGGAVLSYTGASMLQAETRSFAEARAREMPDGARAIEKRFHQNLFKYLRQPFK